MSATRTRGGRGHYRPATSYRETSSARRVRPRFSSRCCRSSPPRRLGGGFAHCLIAERDLPMSASFGELWSMMKTSDFWIAFGQTVRGWAIGLALATALADSAGDRPWLERLPRASLSACRSSFCADPSAADSCPLSHARDEPEQRDFPGDVRRLLAAARADDVRRPRPRPDRHGYCSGLYLRTPAGQDHLAERGPLHHDRAPHLPDRRPHPCLHR